MNGNQWKTTGGSSFFLNRICWRALRRTAKISEMVIVDIRTWIDELKIPPLTRLIAKAGEQFLAPSKLQ